MPIVLREGFLQEMEIELHDLCQPLTAIQCRLEIGQMLGDPASLQDAVGGSMDDMRRIFASVARMRERLVAEDGKNRQEQQPAGSR